MYFSRIGGSASYGQGPNIHGIWSKVRGGHCASCIVGISSLHFRTSALTRDMISIRTLDLADLLSAGGERGGERERERQREKHHYSDTGPEHPIIRHPRVHHVPAFVHALLKFVFALGTRACITSVRRFLCRDFFPGADSRFNRYFNSYPFDQSPINFFKFGVLSLEKKK